MCIRDSDTDVFQPMLKAIAVMSGTEYGKDKQQDIAMRAVSYTHLDVYKRQAE